MMEMMLNSEIITFATLDLVEDNTHTMVEATHNNMIQEDKILVANIPILKCNLKIILKSLQVQFIYIFFVFVYD